MKPGDFRNWLRVKWQDHLLEVESYEGKMPGYNTKYWFNKYKFWLVREFKHETGFNFKKGVDKS